MGKRERKIEAIRNYIENAGGNWPTYSYGKIPKILAINACNSYAGAINPEDILGLIDITIFGNGKKGTIFTENNVYYDNGLLGSTGSVSYKAIYETESVPTTLLDSTYNTNAMLELVSILADIEGESIIETINDGITYVQNIADTVNDGLDFVQNLIELADTMKELLLSDKVTENDFINFTKESLSNYNIHDDIIESIIESFLNCEITREDILNFIDALSNEEAQEF